MAVPGHNRCVQTDEMSIRVGLGRKQFCNGHPEHETKEFNLFVRHGATSGFDARQDIAGHVAAEQLKLSDKLVLSPSPLIAKLRYIRPNNIAVMMHTDLQTSQYVISLEGLN